MDVSPDLLEKLACPRCRGPVELRPDGSGLTCSECRLLYAIEDGIPNMLVEEARPLPDEPRESSP